MPITQPVSRSNFHDAFARCGRLTQFSYEGRNALFDYLEQLSDDLGKPYELDVIALCCEYRELTLRDAIDDCKIDVSSDADDSAKAAQALEYLESRTTVIRVFDDAYVPLDSIVVIQRF